MQVKNAAFKSLTNSNFTIEWWEYRDNLIENTATFVWESGVAIGWYDNNHPNFTNFAIGSDGSSWNIIRNTYCIPIKLKQWVHYALVRTDTAILLYSNGTLIKSVSVPLSTTIPNINTANIDTFSFDGGPAYYDEIRVSNIARYTSNFTPPTTQFNVDDNTISLCHFDKQYQAKDAIIKNAWSSTGLPQPSN